MNFFSFLKLRKKKALFVIVGSFLILSFLSATEILWAASPTVTTGAASSVTKTTAYLNGVITSNGGSDVTASGFNYGMTVGYGSTVSGTISYGYYSQFGSAGSGNGLFNFPYGVATDSLGNIFVTDLNNNRVQKFNSAGAYQSQFGTSGTGNGQFNHPTGIVIDSSDNIYVSDYENDRIQKFTSSGVFIYQIGTTGSNGSNGTAEGEFYHPIGLAVDNSDNLYVVDGYHNRIQKFNSSGTFLMTFGWGVDTGASALQTCTSGCEGGIEGPGDGEFNHPAGVAIDSSGNIYIADTGILLGDNHRIQKFNSAGSFLLKSNGLGGGNGFFVRPWSIVIDSDDNLYVVDSTNARIQKLDSTLSYISKFGTLGSGDGQFNTPLSITIDDNGSMFVVDTGNNRVEKFNLNILSDQITGLTCGTTYHFQAYATNGDGTSLGSDNTFTTSSCNAPDVETEPATGMNSDSATLHGFYTDLGAIPVISRGFEYGPTISYGQTFTENATEHVSSFGLGIITTPYDIFRDSSGNLFVADLGSNQIHKFDSSGNFLFSFGTAGSALGEFNGPMSVLTDSSGNIYVADAGNNRIQKFDSTGQNPVAFGLFGSTFRIAINASDVIYVADYDNGEVDTYNTSGTQIGQFAAGEFPAPYSVDFDSSGNVYVADGSYGAVRKFDSSGVSIMDIGTGEIGSSFTAIVDQSDNSLYVTVSDTGVIRKYDSSGTFVIEFGSTFLSSPLASTIDPSGNVYVADGSGLIQVLNLNFSEYVGSLACGTTYHFRAFATNSDGTGYGSDETFASDDCEDNPPPSGGYVNGCTDQNATNYNPNADVSTNTCVYTVPGCTDSDATNYNSNANTDDGSCLYTPGAIPGCTNPTASNYNALATIDDGTCTFSPPPPPPPPPVPGCTDPDALNYNPNATVADNGSCVYDNTDIGGCTDSTAANYNPNAMIDDGSCSYVTGDIFGCMDSTATNFNSVATIDDGSCSYGSTVTNPGGGGGGGFIPEITFPILTVVGLVVPALLTDIVQPGFLVSLISIPLRLWSLIPILMGYRRKKRPWGTVYDSVTKQPLDPVYVMLKTLDGSERGTSITDIDGRYGFLVEEGSYKISANKDNYIFPSQKLAGTTHDELYDNLYFGETVEVTEKEGVVFKNIPMDAINFNWNEFAKAENKKLMKFYSKRDLFLARVTTILFLFGLISSVVIFYLDNSVINSVVLGLYGLIIFLRFFGVKPKQGGYAFDSDGFPLSFGIIRIFSATLGREVAHTVISKTGKYYLLVPNGRYFARVSRKTGENSYEEVLTTDIFRVKGGYVKQKFTT